MPAGPSLANEKAEKTFLTPDGSFTRLKPIRVSNFIIKDDVPNPLEYSIPLEDDGVFQNA